ncbi:hypothetical protein P7D93_19850, partial [Enterococcus raffinosus]
KFKPKRRFKGITSQNVSDNINIRGGNRMSTDERIATALASIANSLSTLAEDTKASKELKETLIINVNDMQKAIEKLQSDPFGLEGKIK